MKIIYISKYAAYNPFGMDTRHIYMSREMVRQGHDVELILSDSNHNLRSLPTLYTDQVDGVNVRWIKTFKYHRVYSIRRILSWISFELGLRKYLRTLDRDVDAVMVSSLSLLTVFNGIYLKRKKQCKLVFEVRDIWPLVLHGLLGLAKWNPLYKWLASIEKRGYREADLIVGTMPNLEEHVQRQTNLKKKVQWIPHLVNAELHYSNHHRYHQPLSELKRAGKTIVGYAGSINRSSNLEALLTAAKTLESEPLHFVVLGGGPYVQRFKNLCLQNVTFFNTIEQCEVLAFLRDCDVLYDGYLNSELYAYGNSRNKYVEYCLATKPIVMAYAGYPLFVTERQCGITVDPDDPMALSCAIKEIVYKPLKERITMGENALSFAKEHLNTEFHVRQLMEALNV